MADRNLVQQTATTTLEGTDILYAVTGSGTLDRKIIFANFVTEVKTDLALTASNISDFDVEVANNSAVAANTSKVSFDAASSSRLANTSGTNTGDQSLPTRASLGLDTTDTVTFANLSGSNTGDQTSIAGISGTIAQFNTALSDGSFATGGGTATGSNTGDQDLSGKQDNIILTTSGSSGAATLTGATLNIPQYSTGTTSPLTTKGDLYTYSTTNARLGVGTNGQILTADSAEVTGLKWTTVAGSGDVSKVGTPLNNQVGVWTGDGTIEGDVALTFDTVTDTLTTGILNASSLTASELLLTDASKNVVSAAVATYPSLTELSYVKGLSSALQTQLNAKAPLADPTFTGEIGIGAVNVSETELGILEGATVTTTELNYVSGVTSSIQTQLNAKGTLSNVSEDLTPQLGGNLDLNEKGFTKQITLGETVTAGQIVHLHTDGKYYLAEADIPADAVDELVLALAGGVLDGVVAGLVFGYYTTTGLTAGSIYYLSETAGAITATAPTTSLSVVRILGYALSTTVLLFRPDTGYVELA